METLQTVLLVLQVLVSISLIGLILIQHGKGADAGAAFGSGASSTVFGAQGSGNFLTRTTSILAFIFLTNSLGLAWIATQRIQVSGSLMEQVVPGVQAPATQVSDVINDIPADTTSAPATEVLPATSEVPVIPVEQTATSESVPAAVNETAPAVEPAPVEVAPQESLPAVEIKIPEVTVPAVPAEQ